MGGRGTTPRRAPPDSAGNVSGTLNPQTDDNSTDGTDSIDQIVSDAANGAAELMLDGLDLGDRDTDLLNLFVNATVHLAGHPHADLDEIIEANYSDSPKEVRGWCNQ